ncbi:MAG TPA: ribonuclease P protein component [Hyphomicrobium sp.]|nr:ribonuclease P protein component [Hyphomicrobium sp.]
MLARTLPLTLKTIKKRPDFLAVRGGARASVPCCLMEAKPRAPGGAPLEGPRFGFTITKKLGNAVARNRIRRRLKAAISQIAPLYAHDGFDYVLVARAAALDKPYAELVDELTRAFKGVHKPQGARDQRLDKRSVTLKKPQQHGPA